MSLTPDPLTSMTLGQAAKELIYLVECKTCKRQARIDLNAMAQRLGNDNPLAWLKPKLKCSACQSSQFVITTYFKSATTSDAVMRKWPLPGDKADE